MDMGNVDKNVNCPYCKNDDGLKISCEGIARTKGVHLTFDTREETLMYHKDFCIRDLKSCPIAQLVNKKWVYEV